MEYLNQLAELNKMMFDLLPIEWSGSVFVDICRLISRGCALFAVFIFSGATRLPDITLFASEWISATTLLLLAMASSPATILCCSLDLFGYIELTMELLNAIMDKPATESDDLNILPDKVRITHVLIYAETDRY